MATPNEKGKIQWVVVEKSKQKKSKQKKSKQKKSKQIEYNYIYLLQTHHSIDMKEDVYKIGKTTQQNIQRIRNYPKCTKLLLHMECANCHESERILLTKFKKEFVQIKKYGNEYFDGNCEDMKKIIINHIMSNNVNYDTIDNNNERRGFFSSIVNWFRN